jgi:LL-diaminopimelate aminotransferase
VILKNNFEAKRLKTIPPYLFAELDRAKIQYQQKNKTQIIDYGEGNPDLTPDNKIIKCFINALKNSENHRYPTYAGAFNARIAVAEWYKKRFNVDLNPETEVSMLIGSKEGVAHLIWGLIDKDDIIYVPSPSYPVYLNQGRLAGGIPKILPLLENNKFLPDLSKIKPNEKVKLLCLNYPNNPTSAVADYTFYQDTVALARERGFFCFNDNVYSEIYYTEPPHSILEVPGAKEHCVEFHSLSKTFSMAGWRIGFVVGNKNMIKSLLKIKQNTDSGPFNAIQEATIYALKNTELFAKTIRTEYETRLRLLTSELNKLGWSCSMPDATFYLWTKIPIAQYKRDSMAFTQSLLKNTGILIAPGIGFGQYGEGYVRFAAIIPTPEIKETISRLGKFL